MQQTELHRSTYRYKFDRSFEFTLNINISPSFYTSFDILNYKSDRVAWDPLSQHSGVPICRTRNPHNYLQLCETRQASSLQTTIWRRWPPPIMPRMALLQPRHVPQERPPAIIVPWCSSMPADQPNSIKRWQAQVVTPYRPQWRPAQPDRAQLTAPRQRRVHQSSCRYPLYPRQWPR